MEKIKIQICHGTTCFVMGASRLSDLETRIPHHLKKHVDIRVKACLGLCNNDEYSKAPYVMVGSEVISEATIETIIGIVQRQIKQAGFDDERA